MRAHREVTVRTMTLVVALLHQKSVTARVWLAILGLVVYVSLYARPALSFLGAVFHEADAYEPGVVFIPSKRARAELATWLSFVPFMSVDLRAEVDTRVFATDASSRSCAAVVSQLPEALVREIWRQRPRRGVLQRYAGEDQSDAFTAKKAPSLPTTERMRRRQTRCEQEFGQPSCVKRSDGSRCSTTPYGAMNIS